MRQIILNKSFCSNKKKDVQNNLKQIENHFILRKNRWRKGKMAGNMIEVLFFLVFTSASFSSPAKGLTCNGMAEFCDLRINQVTFAGTHNSGAGFDGILYYHTSIGLRFPAMSCWYRNQGQSITKQLDNGIRYFDIDTCFVDSERWEHGPWTCHSGAYGGPVRKILKQIDEWMQRNPNDVVVIKFGRDTVNSKAQRIGGAILEQVIIRLLFHLRAVSVLYLSSTSSILLLLNVYLFL